MSNKTIKVRGILGCAGAWGSIGPGEEKELPLEVAEGLIRAGFAEPLEDVTNGAPAAEIEKKEKSAPKKRSKRAKKS